MTQTFLKRASQKPGLKTLGRKPRDWSPIRVKPLVSGPGSQKPALFLGGGKRKQKKTKKTSPQLSLGPKPRNWWASSSKTLAFGMENFGGSQGQNASRLVHQPEQKPCTSHCGSSQDQKTLPSASHSGGETVVSLVPSHSHSSGGRDLEVGGFFERGTGWERLSVRLGASQTALVGVSDIPCPVYLPCRPRGWGWRGRCTARACAKGRSVPVHNP